MIIKINKFERLRTQSKQFQFRSDNSYVQSLKAGRQSLPSNRFSVLNQQLPRAAKANSFLHPDYF